MTETLENAKSDFNIDFHGLRHLSTGDGYRIEAHLLFQDELSIRETHQIATEIEQRIMSAIDAPAHVVTHLEPMRDHSKQHPKSPH